MVKCYKFRAHTPLYNIEFDFSQFSESVLRAGCSEKLVHVIKIAGVQKEGEAKYLFARTIFNIKILRVLSAEKVFFHTSTNR